jgi:hypothetical protein
MQAAGSSDTKCEKRNVRNTGQGTEQHWTDKRRNFVTVKYTTVQLTELTEQQELSKIRHDLLYEALPDCYCTVRIANSIYKHFLYVCIEQQ